MLGDIQIAEPNALIGFAGPRVIEQTIRETLPEGFQRAEYLLEHGMLDMVVHRRDLPATLGRVVGLLLDHVPQADVVPLPRPGLEIPPPGEIPHRSQIGCAHVCTPSLMRISNAVYCFQPTTSTSNTHTAINSI